ncbi:MaoC family dehydratase [Profundibacter amoris]|uniref:(R)-hydratase n=1 Tax=Profundibacter amoris TaxID=2171755 RepID=A0A347UIX0_9RHOB|nr:MaoC family dehydratase [Profundibacter amoris]AXX98798.1 (R)-hydratase [Profundibacter amoris]
MTNSEIGTIFLEDLETGMSRSITKVIDEHAINLFAEVSEDRNPLHLDEDAGAASIFKTRIAHGMLSAGLFSALIGERLPGHGSIYMSQNLRFTAPVRIGETVTATVTVTNIIPEKRRVALECVAKVGDTVVITGDALVLAPSRAKG